MLTANQLDNQIVGPIHLTKYDRKVLIYSMCNLIKAKKKMQDGKREEKFLEAWVVLTTA